jgi:hypothetical protein
MVERARRRVLWSKSVLDRFASVYFTIHKKVVISCVALEFVICRFKWAYGLVCWFVVEKPRRFGQLYPWFSWLDLWNQINLTSILNNQQKWKAILNYFALCNWLANRNCFWSDRFCQCSSQMEIWLHTAVVDVACHIHPRLATIVSYCFLCSKYSSIFWSFSTLPKTNLKS